RSKLVSSFSQWKGQPQYDLITFLPRIQLAAVRFGDESGGREREVRIAVRIGVVELENPGQLELIADRIPCCSDPDFLPVVFSTDRALLGCQYFRRTSEEHL